MSRNISYAAWSSKPERITAPMVSWAAPSDNRPEHDPEKWKPVSRLREARFAGEARSDKIMLERMNPEHDPEIQSNWIKLQVLVSRPAFKKHDNLRRPGQTVFGEMEATVAGEVA
jgi:hypothetical protein